jgi:hypothetical protein
VVFEEKDTHLIEKKLKNIYAYIVDRMENSTERLCVAVNLARA